MGRRKLKLELIINKRERLAVFRRKQKSLEKAADQLSTLCGVHIGIITYGPTGDGTLWPPGNHQLVSKLLEDYQASHRHRKYDLDAYFKDETNKMEKKLQKMREATHPKWLQSLDHMSCDQLTEFTTKLTDKIDAVKGRLSRKKEEEWDVLMHKIAQESGGFFGVPQPWAGTVQQAYNDGSGNLAYQRTGMTSNGAACCHGTYGYMANERMMAMGNGALSNQSQGVVETEEMRGNGQCLLDPIPLPQMQAAAHVPQLAFRL